jgi:predicted CopG family antitoxin
MLHARITVASALATRLQLVRADGESYSDVIARLLDEQPAKTVDEWMESLAPLDGQALFTPAERAHLMHDQGNPRHSCMRKNENTAGT